MSHRFTSCIGAVVLGFIAANAACGSRDTLVVDSDGIYGGAAFAGSVSQGGTGNVSSGGRAGMSSGGSFGAHAGVGSFPSGGSGVGGSGFAGTLGLGGAAQAGSLGFAGFGAIGAVGGSLPDWCAACLAQNGASPSCTVIRCDFQTNLCRVVAVTDGSACNDDDLCTEKVCMSGKCLPRTTVTCPISTTPCMVSACDPALGTCVDNPATGTRCDDGDPCTDQDQCTMGKCMPGTALQTCKNNDKCCPAGCTSSTDNDCKPATQVTLNTSDRGWYEGNGLHDPINKNTFTGFSPPGTYNSFFSFDLSGITGTIVSAQLSLLEETFYGVDMTETASIWDVRTSADVLSSTRQSVPIFQDLQSGNRYGTLTGNPGLHDSAITTPLNAQAVADLNAARGRKFSIGVHIDTLSGQTHADEGLRFSQESEVQPNRLLLTVQ